MRDKDKQLLARAEMLKLQKIVKQMRFLYDEYEQSEALLYGTGIDYSRDIVQTSPKNQIEEIICNKLTEIENKLTRLAIQKKYYLDCIYKLPDDELCNVLIDKHVNCKTFLEISRDNKQSKTTTYRVYEKALTFYHTTNLCNM